VAPWLAAGLIVFAAIGLAYVWMDGQSELLGRELRRLEEEHSKLVKQHLNEEYRWARLKSPQSVEKALAEHRLIMSAPRHDQVVRLTDSAPSDRRLLAVLGTLSPRRDGKIIRE
jgi:hypothetical protein